MSDGMGRELAYLSSHATNRYFIPNWGKEWNDKGYGGIGEIRATANTDYKYYNNALHKRIEDIDMKIHQYYEIHQHITCDIIRSFLDDNDEVLRPDGGKDFITFAKELIGNYSANAIA